MIMSIMELPPTGMEFHEIAGNFYNSDVIIIFYWVKLDVWNPQCSGIQALQILQNLALRFVW